MRPLSLLSNFGTAFITRPHILSYASKLVDIGDGRDTALKQGKSKYLEKKSTIRKEQVLDLGDGKFMVESEKN